jgi:hypothetical protein
MGIGLGLFVALIEGAVIAFHRFGPRKEAGVADPISSQNVTDAMLRGIRWTGIFLISESASALRFPSSGGLHFSCYSRWGLCRGDVSAVCCVCEGSLCSKRFYSFIPIPICILLAVMRKRAAILRDLLFDPKWFEKDALHQYLVPDSLKACSDLRLAGHGKLEITV